MNAQAVRAVVALMSDCDRWDRDPGNAALAAKVMAGVVRLNRRPDAVELIAAGSAAYDRRG